MLEGWVSQLSKRLRKLKEYVNNKKTFCFCWVKMLFVLKVWLFPCLVAADLRMDSTINPVRQDRQCNVGKLSSFLNALSFCDLQNYLYRKTYLKVHKTYFKVHTIGVNLCPECLSMLWWACHESEAASTKMVFFDPILTKQSQAEFTLYVGRSPDYRSLSNMPLKTVSFSLIKT